MAVLSIVLGAVAMAASGSPADLAKFLPAEVRGWRADGADERADRDSLFSLIDGGAEPYRALNVKRVLERRYVKQGGSDIIVDLFDMGSSADAYGAYHHPMREGRSAGIGRESELLGGNLMFWKGPFFGSVVPLRSAPDVVDVVLAIGKSIAAAIPDTGEPPSIVRLLPPAGLVASQVHYFHDWPLLAMHAFASGENVLGLGRDTEGVLARYRLAPADAAAAPGSALLVVRFPTVERARSAYAELVKTPSRLAPQNRLAPRLAGRVVLVVIDAPTPAAAAELLATIPNER